MASITIKNVPEELHVQLKQMAKRDRRSLNQEILQQLRCAVSAVPKPAEVKARLAALDRHHKALLASGYVPPPPEEIVRIIREGRESH